MKVVLLLFVLILATHSSVLQAQDRIRSNVSFVTTIDIRTATKDGIYLNGYVVNIPYDKLQQLNGKRVRIRGKVTIVKGLKVFNDGETRQGREEDTKHIINPKITIVAG